MTAKSKKSRSDYGCINIICGKDSFLVSNEVEYAVSSLLSEDQRAMSLYQPRSDQVEISQVLDELRTLPFLAKKRVVLLKDADSFVSLHREAIEKYLDNPSKSGILILTVKTWRKNTRLAKKVAKIGNLISIEDVKPWQLPNYAVSSAGEHNKILDRNAAQLLVELTGDDSGRLHSEVEKLCMYTGQKNKITIDDVEKLVGNNRMFNAFNIIDSITKGDSASALGRLRKMFESDKSSEFTVIGAFAYHFRKLFSAKALQEKGLNPSQIASQLGIWANKEGFFKQLRGFTLSRAASVLSELAQIDYAVKTGRTSCTIAMEKLVVKLSMN